MICMQPHHLPAVDPSCSPVTRPALANCIIYNSFIKMPLRIVQRIARVAIRYCRASASASGASGASAVAQKKETSSQNIDSDEDHLLLQLLQLLIEVSIAIAALYLFCIASSAYFSSTSFPFLSMQEYDSSEIPYSIDRRSLTTLQSVDTGNLRGAPQGRYRGQSYWSNFSEAMTDEDSRGKTFADYKDTRKLQHIAPEDTGGFNISSTSAAAECKWGDTHITSPKSPLYLTEYQKDTTAFLDPNHEFASYQNCSASRGILFKLAEKPFYDLLDLVVIVSHSTELELLFRNWERELRIFHTIFILDDTVKEIPTSLPKWLKYELHTAASLRSCLGSNGWVVGSSEGGIGDSLSMISLGEWISMKEYVYVISDHSKISTPIKSCFSIVESHLFNILTPVVDDFRHCQVEISPGTPPKDRHLRILSNHNHQEHAKHMNHLRKQKGIGVSENGIVSMRKTLLSVEESNNNININNKNNNNNNIVSPKLSLERKKHFNVPLGMNQLLLRFNNSLIRSRLFANSLWSFTPSHNRLYDGANFTEYTEAAQLISSWMLKTYLDWIREGVKVVSSTASDEGDYYRGRSDMSKSTNPPPSLPPLSSLPSQLHGGTESNTLSSPDSYQYYNFKRKLSMVDRHYASENDFISTIAGWSHLNERVRAMLVKVYSRIQSFNISHADTRYNSQCPQHLEYPLTCYTTELYKYVLSESLDLADSESRIFIQYMQKMAQSWFQVWASRKLFTNNLLPVAVQSYFKPNPRYLSGHHHSCAIVTISHNEADLLPIWLRYYARHFEHRNMYVLDHMTSDGSLDHLPKEVNLLKFNSNYTMPVHERSDTIRYYQDFLLRQGYKCVVYSDVDEIIVPDPIAYPGGLKEYLQKFLENEKLKSVKVKAYDLGHMSYGDAGKTETIEPPIDWTRNILQQRHFAAENRYYDKALITKVPLDYRPGFHKLYDMKLDNKINVDEQLIMFHLSNFDKDWCMGRMKYKGSLTARMKPEDANGGYADHWKRISADMKKGLLCRYAVSCLIEVPKGEKGSFHVGDNNSKVKYLAWDNLGQVPMWRIPDYWRTGTGGAAAI